ncbi:deferrochelatase/peroxidase EfeB [Pararobbsia alpina]
MNTTNRPSDPQQQTQSADDGQDVSNATGPIQSGCPFSGFSQPPAPRVEAAQSQDARSVGAPSHATDQGAPAQPSRRGFLKAGGLAAAAGAGLGAAGLAQAALDKPAGGAAASALSAKARMGAQVEPFYGEHQSGVVTPQQTYTYFAALDVTTNHRDELIELLKTWTEASARLTRGDTAKTIDPDDTAAASAKGAQSGAQPAAKDDAELGAMSTLPDAPAGASAAATTDVSGAPADDGYAAGGATPTYSAAVYEDSAEALGLGASRLTLTFGFGPTLFTRDGADRFGIAKRRPDALVDLPRFNGDQIVKEKSGGDLCIQACAMDAQVAFHAVRQLARLANGKAQIKWVQSGFLSQPGDGTTARNLMGFRDGTNNPPTRDPALMDKFIWAGDEGPAWMRGGTYTVFRRIRITLEHWDNTEVSFQEAVFGRHKYSGAPLGKQKEFDALDFDAKDARGNPVVPENSHVRLSNRAQNNGMQLLRRSYSYNDGANFYIERWPPWRQELEYDAGLLFVAHQRDPRSAFIPINARLAATDLMNQFTTHVGSAIFALPPGAKQGSYIGAGLFEA